MPDHSTPAQSLDLVGSAEAEEMLGRINRTTLTRWVALGRLPLAHKLPGRNGAMLFQRQDVIALKAELDAAASTSNTEAATA